MTENNIKFAHDKLLELGYTLLVDRDDYIQYELVFSADKNAKYSNLIHIYLKDKTYVAWYRFDNYWTGAAVSNTLFLTEEMEEILSQYLEELKC